MLQISIRSAPALALAAFVAACGGAVEIEPTPMPAPAPDGEQAISITPDAGTTATTVTVTATGFAPGTRVDIGFGPPASEYDVLKTVRAGSDGVVRATVEIPEWVERRDYVFVAAGPGDQKLISERFRVTATGEDRPERVRVTGVLTDEGVECPALRTDDGDLYTLAGDTGEFVQGDRVTVEGTVAEASICMQGTTIEVEDITGSG